MVLSTPKDSDARERREALRRELLKMIVKNEAQRRDQRKATET
ncbi:MAG: hypothetical protein WD063_16105 [Pirellulales bacterium]